MTYPCTSCTKSGKKCVVLQSSKLCSECTRYSRKCDVDRSSEINRLDAEEDKLLTEANEAEDEALRLLSRARRLRKQAGFLSGRNRSIVKGELDGLESLADISPDIRAGLSDPPVPNFASSPTASEFWGSLGETLGVSLGSEPDSSTVPRNCPSQGSPST
jgi:hypothetical protein